MKAMAGIRQGWVFGGLLGKGFLGYSLYEGYKEGGMGGMAKAGASYMAMGYLWGLGSMAAPYVAGVAGLGAMAYKLTGGSFKSVFRPLVAEQMARHERLEMGKPFADDFGTVATMRQRSLQAIQNSRLNGRTALGSEASLAYQYQPYYR